MKNLVFCLGLLLLCPQISQGEITQQPQGETTQQPRSDTTSAEAEAGWHALPRSRPFPSLLSDPRDLRLGLRRNNKAELEADVGGYRSLVGFTGDEITFHGGIEGAGFFQMRQEGSKFPLQSSDGLIGLYGEASKGDWAAQLRFTHISAHLSDGITSTRKAILYTREFLALRMARQLGVWRAYAGVQALTHTAPDLPRASLQLGGYGILPCHWGIVHPYFGGDLRVRGVSEGTTFQLGTGAAVVSAAGAPPVRFTVSYLKGHDLRGQFYDEKTEKWIFGLDLEI